MRILLLADIHIGSISDTDYVTHVLDDILDKELITHSTDMVVVLGDLFHRLLKANEAHTAVVIRFVTRLIHLAKRNRTVIRFIYGTESHEMSQYQLIGPLTHLADSDTDTRVIRTATEETVLGKRILYLPEEYHDDPVGFYCPLLQKQYDYIFGHGIINEGVPLALAVGTPGGYKSKHHFKVKELSGISTLTCFGHYHCHVPITKNCYYVGSLFRDRFGEEGPKGYGVIEDNGFLFIENKDVYTYDTIDIPLTEMETHTGETIFTRINGIKSTYDDLLRGDRKGKLRIVFHLPPGDSTVIREVIRKSLVKDSLISTKYIDTMDPVTSESTIAIEYDYLLDESLPVNEKIHRYIRGLYPSSLLTADDILSIIRDEIV